MKLSRILHILPGVIAALYDDPKESYESAMAILNSLPELAFRSYYSDMSIYGNLYIPQFNPEIGDYEHLPPKKPFLWLSSEDVVLNDPDKKLKHDYEVSQALTLLEDSASLNHHQSLLTLADFYMFGNHSISTNYTKSLQYYHKAVESKGDGHAYFMLGYIYSSGLFGEVEIDQTKANLYFQFGMENGDVGSIIALGYRNDLNVDSCEMALHYYSRAAHLAKNIFDEDEEEEKEVGLSQNIRLVDFNGGIYGKKMSEMSRSVSSRQAMYLSTVEAFEEINVVLADHEYVEMYYNAMSHYHGDYAAPRNSTKAREFAQQCVNLGVKTYGSMRYSTIDAIDAIFLSDCQYLLGHMYLKGQGGVERNATKAFELLADSMHVQANGAGSAPSIRIQNGAAAADLGYIYEHGLLEKYAPQPNLTRALELYSASSQKEHASGKLSAVKIYSRLGELATDNEKLVSYKLLADAAYLGDFESLYHMANFYEKGYNKADPDRKPYNCNTNLLYYRLFVERSDRYLFPHLRYAFEELAKGNHKNALLGYLIAAEQGLEKAQISAAYLLYQLQPFRQPHNRKTFTEKRLKAAIRYLKKASQKNVDATILLGDIYLNGVPESNITKDENKAFDYYKVATLQHSSHGSYKLAHMYEYGYGQVNNSVDYFMAKRYYDLSMDWKTVDDKDLLSVKFPIGWALLRLRLKHMFGKGKDTQSNSWLSSLKNMGKRNKASTEGEETKKKKPKDKKHDRANAKANAHHEGGDFPTDGDDEYFFQDIINSGIVVVLIGSFILQQYRAFRNRRNVQLPADPNVEPVPRVQGDGRFRFAFEFQFFAL